MQRSRWIVILAVVAGLAIGAVLRPPTGLPGDPAADRQGLASEVRERFDLPGVHGVAAAVVRVPPGTTGADVQTVAIGAPLDGMWELGSVSKTLTGMLYVDAIERGELAASDTLGQHLKLGDAPAAKVTLASLSQHRSGLPRIAPGLDSFWRSLGWIVAARNPYGEDLETLQQQLRGVQPGEPRSAYSNLGMEALGAAVASAAGTTYPQLLRERLAKPLGLGLSVPESDNELPETSVQGRDRAGRRQQAWTGEALGPAGGVRASIDDMGKLLAAILAGKAPGLGALEPAADFAPTEPADGPVRIGAAWMTTDRGGRTLTFHNGITGGFRSWVGIDREAGVGLAVLTATSRDEINDRSADWLVQLGREQER